MKKGTLLQQALDRIEVAVMFLEDDAPHTALDRLNKAVEIVEKIAKRKRKQLAGVMGN